MRSLRINSLFLFKAIFLILLVPNLFGKFIPGDIDGLVDEACCVVVVCLILFKLLKGARSTKEITLVVPFFIISLIFGLLGNLFFSYVTNITCIARDAFFTYKPYVFFLFGILFMKNNDGRFLHFCRKISKIMICLIFIVAVMDYLGDLGLKKNGLFSFFSTATSGCIAWWLILFVSLVFMGKGRKLIYLFFTAIALFFIDSGLGNFSLAMTIPVYYFLEKRKNINKKYLILIIPIGFFLAGTEITVYLMNENAPRYVLHKYAFITANDCFPFGSGFGSFGGNTAIDYYSPLYYKYGFFNMYGMSKENSSFLMDSYYPMIIAQFGYVGLVAFLCMIVQIVRKRTLMIENKKLKIWLTFLFGVWIVAGLGFGTGSNWGCCVLFLVGALSESHLNKRL